MRVIDAHAHAFPDALAARAVPHLEAQGNIKACLDGTVAALLRSMDQAGIETAVICSIATKPDQFPAIVKWSHAIASPRLVPLASVHPADPHVVERVKIIQAEGFKGLKLHPYYQDYDLDEERLLPLYAAVEEAGLILVSHTGFDIAYPRERKADPVRIANVLQRFPQLKFVATHLGAWEDWAEVRRLLLGKPIYLEISCALEGLTPAEARAMLEAHPADRILFGTDTPWNDQATAVAQVRALGLDPDREARLLGLNAAELFGL